MAKRVAPILGAQPDAILFDKRQVMGNGKALNPSPFLAHLKRLFPTLQTEVFPRTMDWRRSEHTSELIAPLLKQQFQISNSKFKIDDLPALKQLRDRLRHFFRTPEEESLSPALAEKLYGLALRTSVSRMEQFAACPFKFLVHSGLRAEERKKYELDIREQGNFQHEVLALFHDQWNPRIVGELNGQHVKLVKFQGEFVWHKHDHEDELFLVIKGRFRMEYRDRHVW